MRRVLPTVLLAAACASGPRVNKFAPIRSPGGAIVTVARGHTRFNAELLAVTDTALVLVDLDSQRVVLATYQAFSRVRFRSFPWTVEGGRPLTSRERERLRPWTRYPEGVDADRLPRLLAAYAQESLVVLAPCPTRSC